MIIRLGADALVVVVALTLGAVFFLIEHDNVRRYLLDKHMLGDDVFPPLTFLRLSSVIRVVRSSNLFFLKEQHQAISNHVLSERPNIKQ